MKTITKANIKPMSIFLRLKNSRGVTPFMDKSQVFHYDYSMPFYRRTSSICWEGKQRYNEDIFYGNQVEL